MSGRPESLAGAAFLSEPGFRAVVAAVERRGDKARAVGGAVRNTLLGEPVDDVDIATTARPETVMERAAAAGLQAIPTGIEHGTVTVVAHGVPYEVTTLRADVETDGRRAVVAFTDDWTADAERRDFTMNAIYADADGRLHDPVGGVPDALARRLRFIGTPEDRIREDYLRILRFFRFHARYGNDAPDASALAACVGLKEGLLRLSRERIGGETRKLVLARRAAETLRLMEVTGVLPLVLGSGAAVDTFSAAVDLAARAGAPFGVEARLAALAAVAKEDADRLADRLRLSREETETIAAIAQVSALLGPTPDDAAARTAVYRFGNAVATAAVVHAAARAGAGLPAAVVIARDWSAPRFPVTGRDLLAAGMAPGPAVGERLRAIEADWIAEGFPPAAEFRARNGFP